MRLTQLVIELQESGQHGGGARNLLLLMHRRGVWGVRLEVVCNTLTDKRQQRQQIVAFAVLIKFGAQRLHEPRALGGVAPRIEP